MWTDATPRARDRRREYDASDAAHTLRLPPGEPLQALSTRLRDALVGAEPAAVQGVGQQLLAELAAFYAVSTPQLKVLGTRPHRTSEGRLSYELFGDYDLRTAIIRGWMRTAMQGRVTSHRGFLNTLLHEFCHHLDVHSFGWPATPHTRGFFWRVDELYHLALATPPGERKPLVWIARGTRWQIDWRKLRRPG
jgi:hypothetical protein